MKEILSELNEIIEEFENSGLYRSAADLHEVFIRLAKIPVVKETGHKSPPKEYPKKKNEYGDPNNYKYPLDTEKHVRAAWSYIHMERNQKGYSTSEVVGIKGRIRAAAKKFGIELEAK